MINPVFSRIFYFPQYRPQTLKTANFNSKLLILWLTTGGKEYFFMDRTGLREFLSFEREFWSTFFKKINFPSVHLLAHSVVLTYPNLFI